MGYQQVITCTGFGGTGSSAISDFLKEFDNVKSLGDFEFSLAHEVDGISDLQHGIVDDFHRNKTSETIYRFRQLTKKLAKTYNQYFENQFSEVIEDYLQEIVQYKWKGFWHQHIYRSGIIKKYIFYIIPYILQYRLGNMFSKTGYEFVPKMPFQTMEIGRGENRFFNATQNLYEKLFSIINPDNEYKYLHLDQLVPPHNYDRYLKYFHNLKVVQVDRDPRDLYLLNELFWHEGWIPSRNATEFVEWFKLIRSEKKTKVENPNIIKIKFEDIVYDYDETTDSLISFLGLDKTMHSNRKKYFDPDISKKNTLLWKKFKGREVEIEYIEKHLNSYCYGL